MRENLGNVYRSKHWAAHRARGRPIRNVPGGWMICRYSKKRRRKARRHKVNRKRIRKRPSKGKIKPVLTIKF